ncbi:MAG: exosortase/archaeosortase family protein [Candidatus Gottesmanbacteria bacterium]
MRPEKKTFAIIFALLAIMLAILPFLVTFNEVLTKVVERLNLYGFIQATVVPIELRMLGTIVTSLGIDFSASNNVMVVNGHFAAITWNCLGWQSLLLFVASLAVGLHGPYTLTSKAEVVLIGLLGTFLVNLGRLVIIVLLLAYSKPFFAVVYHDYLAAIVTIVWLFFFWWFAYSFVLEEKQPISPVTS